MVRKSNTRHERSRDVDAKSRLVPAFWNLVFVTVCLKPWRVVMALAVRGSHNLMRLSLDPDTMRPRFGCQSAHLTSQWWPANVRSSLPLLKFQILMDESSEHVRNLESLGENAMSRMASVWPCKMLTLLKLGCQYLMAPSWSPLRSQSSLWEYLSANTARSWACMIVSKLNVMPFQMVNSPLCDATTSRRPSGVHLTVLIECLALFSDKWTNFVCTSNTPGLDATLSREYANDGSKSIKYDDSGRMAPMCWVVSPMER